MEFNSLGSMKSSTNKSKFVFLESCFRFDTCQNQTLLLAYGLFVSALILIIIRIWMFMQLLKVYKNFGYGLADSGKSATNVRFVMKEKKNKLNSNIRIDCLIILLFSQICVCSIAYGRSRSHLESIGTAFIDLVTETTRLLMRSSSYRQSLDLWASWSFGITKRLQTDHWIYLNENKKKTTTNDDCWDPPSRSPSFFILFESITTRLIVEQILNLD